MEPNATAPSVPIEKPFWKKPWFWVAAAGAMTFLFLVALGLVATLVVPRVLKKFQFASRKKAEADIHAIDSALTEYAIANGGKFPDSLVPLVTPDVNGQTFLDTRSLPKDPWGRGYEYDPPGPGSPKPRIRSLGRDGQLGGEGDDADIDNFSLESTK